MAIKSTAPGVSEVTRAGLERIATGPLAARLQASLRRRHPRRSREEVADSFQEAYARALRSCPVEDEPAIYAWLWRTMDNVLVDRLRLLARESLTFEVDREPAVPADLGASPEHEFERAEERDALAQLFGTLTEELAARQRAVLGLYVRGLKRPQVARQLGLSERVVKRDLERILARARVLLVERCGGGCPDGSRLVWRFAFGLASGSDAAQAQLHLVSCSSCQAFLERLASWREAAAAAVPLPAAEQATPGLLERGVHGLADIAGSVRERLAPSGSGVRQHVADGAAQLKQSSVSVYARAIDPTPLTGVRPGAAAATISACLAIGAGAVYCADRAVGPLPDFGLGDRPATQREQPQPERQVENAALADPEPAPVELLPPTNPEVAPEPAQPVQPVVETPPNPAPAPPPPPPPEEEFDPAAAAAAAAQPAPQPTVPSAPASAPSPAPETGVGEFLNGP